MMSDDPIKNVTQKIMAQAPVKLAAPVPQKIRIPDWREAIIAACVGLIAGAVMVHQFPGSYVFWAGLGLVAAIGTGIWMARTNPPVELEPTVEEKIEKNYWAGGMTWCGIGIALATCLLVATSGKAADGDSAVSIIAVAIALVAAVGLWFLGAATKD